MPGMSTPRVDELASTIGGCQVSKSKVSWICQKLDSELAPFRDRTLDDITHPYVWSEATYKEVLEVGTIVS